MDSIKVKNINDEEINNCCGTTCNKGMILNQLANYKAQNQLLTQQVEKLLAILQKRNE